MNRIMESGAVEMNVVLYPEDGGWIAQGLEFDITARGGTPNEAAKRFDAKVGAELVMSAELGDVHPLAGVAPAPQKFWQMFSGADMRVQKDETPMRLADTANTPRVRPNIRIASEPLVAA